MLSASAASLLLGGGTQAFAACTPATNNYINNGTITGLCLTGTLSGNIESFGTISPGGVSLTGATLTGEITSLQLSTTIGGITLDKASRISSTATAVGIEAATFAGGVSNAGTISTTGLFGIGVQLGNTFAGGISNSGTISAGSGYGIYIRGFSAFSGGISNSGTISAGRDDIVIGSVSTFSGGISNTGTLSASVPILVAASAPVSIFDSGTIVATGNTAVDLSGNAAGNIFTLGGGYSITGNVVGQGSDSFQLGGTTAGSFNLSLIGGQYTGFTTFNVVGGTWTVSGSTTTDWTVSGGTLTGAATIGGVTVTGGTFAPGAPGAAMTVNGNLVLQSAAVYMVTINGANASSANVAGTASIANGARFAIAAGSTPVVNTTYAVMTANGGVSGSFVNPNIFFGIYEGTLSQVGNTIDLTVKYGSLQPLLPANAPANVVNVANAIDTAIQNGVTPPAGFQALFNLPPAQLQSALAQISGESSTDAGKGVNQMMTELLNLMLDPTAGGGSLGSAGAASGFAPERDGTLPSEIAMAYAKAFRPQATQPAPQTGWTAWGSAFGAASNTGGNAAAGTNSVTASDYGVAAGMEYRLSPDLAYGFSLAGGGTNWNLAQGLGSGRSDSFMAGAYAKGHVGAFYLSGALAFANNWFTTNRTALGDQLQATFTGQSYAARGEAGYRYALPVTESLLGITPYAALQVNNLRTPGYSERDLTGGGFGLTYASANSTDTRGELGARFDNLQMLNGMPLVLRGRLAWAHDWTGNSALNATFQSFPGASFTVNGAAVPKDSALATAAAELHINANWTAIAKFDGEFGGGSQTYAGTGTLRYTW